MQVKEIIALAAGNLNRDDLIDTINSAEAAENDEVKTLLRCYNAVENEIALDYYPLKKEESFPADQGKLLYTLFSERPVYIHKATDSGGRELKFEMRTEFLKLPENAAEVTVLYSYAPEKKALNGESELPEKFSRLVSYGVACEYLLVAGRYEEAAIWEKRYREALRAAGILRRKLSVSARRWV